MSWLLKIRLNTLALLCSYRWPRGVRFSEDVKDLIQSLLKRNPQERPSAKQLLSHAWVRGSRPVSARALLVASQKLNRGPKSHASDCLAALPSRGDSPLVQQLIADARLTPNAIPWPQSPGTSPPSSCLLPTPPPTPFSPPAPPLPPSLALGSQCWYYHGIPRLQ